MISKMCGRAWLLALVGASILTFTPRFLHADSDQGREMERSEHQERDRDSHCDDRDRDEISQTRSRDRSGRQDGARPERQKKQRNMHPELQVATPFNSRGDCSSDE